MLNVVSTKITQEDDVVGNVALVHSPIYTIVCQDRVGNNFEVETNKETFLQITDFLDKLKEV